MQAWQATVQDDNGNVVVNPSITVYQADGVTLAQIYNENETPKGNPFIGTLEGFVQFWAEAGTYKIQGAVGSDLSELWEWEFDDSIPLPLGFMGAVGAGHGIVIDRNDGTFYKATPQVLLDGLELPDGTSVNDALNTSRAFGTREALAAALPDLTQGQTVSVSGIPATVDAAATGNASALHDLGVNGVRLKGKVVDGRWFGVQDGATNAHQRLAAANTYAMAQKGGANSISLELSGTINLAEPVTLGGPSIALFHVDWSALTINCATGGSLAANSQLYALTIQSANSNIKCGRINGNKVCNGLRLQDCGSTYVQAPNIRRFVNVGIEVVGNSAGMNLETPTVVEWVGSDPAYSQEALYIGTCILANGPDFIISGGQCGWAKRVLHITANGGGVECHGFHPYNGDVTATFRRQHPVCVLNEAAGPAFLYDCYVDNGYIDDRSGTLVIQGGWHLVLPNRVELAHPYTRVSSNPIPNADGGYIDNFGTSLGFVDRTVFNGQIEPIVLIAEGQSNMRGNADATGGARVAEPGVRVWNGGVGMVGTAFVQAASGSYPMDQAGGLSSNLAIETANMLKRMTGRDVYLIMMAAGGARIERFIRPATISANGWTQDFDYTATIYSQIPTALASIPGRNTPYADAFLWHQGEANGADSAAVYQAKWLAMEADMRAAGFLSPVNTTLVAGGLAEGQTNRATIEAAIRGAMTSRPNLVFVESDGLAVSSVPVHFTGQSLERLGVGYADAILTRKVPSNSNPASQRGRGRKAGYCARETKLIPATSDPVDKLVEKQGAGAKYLERYYAGPTAPPLDVIYKDGAVVVVGKVLANDNSDVGFSASGGTLNLHAGNDIRWQIGDSGNLYPFVDNVVNLGTLGRRINTIFAGSGTINTSDERMKTDIREVSDAEARVAKAIKGLIRAYKFRDAVKEKGNGARWHFGVIAQDVAKAFSDEGLDPFEYGVVCFDADEQGGLWGVRYEELSMFILSVS